MRKNDRNRTQNIEKAPSGVGALNEATKSIRLGELENNVSLFDEPSQVINGNGTGETSAPPSINDVLAVVHDAFPDDPSISLAVEGILSAASVLCIKGLEGCPAILLEGPAASRKTTVLRFLPKELKDIVYWTDKFTPASFVSNMAGMTKEQLNDIDLLPRISHKVFVVPEMRVTFSERKEKLQENLGVLTRILDGHGYSTDTGVYGHREHVGDLKFCFLGATTPLSDFAWQEMSNVGSRMLVLDMSGVEPTAEQLAQMVTDAVGFEEKVKRCKAAVGAFLQGTWERTGGYGGVSWDSQSPNEAVVALKVGGYALLTARLRGQIIRSGEDDSEKSIQVENPIRLASVLMNTARGHAIASGRTELELDDVRVVRELALDTCPNRRRAAFRCLFESALGVVTTDDVAGASKSSKGTALKLMEDLVTLGVAQKVKKEGKGYSGMQEANRIRLADEFVSLANR